MKKVYQLVYGCFALPAALLHVTQSAPATKKVLVNCANIVDAVAYDHGVDLISCE